jgi:HAD superfamily hydrolase (TIGR01509 family)
MKTNRFSEFIETLPFTVEAFLFDLDGVLLDSEGGYQLFWEKIAVEYGLDPKTFPFEIKGQNIYDTAEIYFSQSDRNMVVKRFMDYQLNMTYKAYEGLWEVLGSVKAQGIKTAIVTSSNKVKMEVVYAHHPSFEQFIDALITAEDTVAKKPAPDCWLKAAEVLGVAIKNSVVFEDSVLGLKSGMASGAFVVGLTTSHDAATIKPLCHRMINQISDLI